MQLDCILEEEREFDRMREDDYDDDFDSDDFDDYQLKCFIKVIF